jgi:lipopolysaccharide/colanic/teichoic acid biosynthesis glycosyltransferase
MKRVFDITFSLLGLVFFIPVFLLVSLISKLFDRGPIFFKQKRVGKNGNLFIIYKFRSMSVLESAEEGYFEPGNTLRVTPLGRFLRNTKLDELPQLINVLLGNMSIVGPRPEIEKWVTMYPERWKIILTIKPGMTDNASIIYRSEETLLAKSENAEKTYREIILPRKMELYENYVLNNSFIGDIKLICQTLFCIFFKATVNK